jgi:metallo-beta-lactamase class B
MQTPSLLISRRSVLRSGLATLGALTTARIVDAIDITPAGNPDWITAFPPHRVGGNLYYVGSRDLASFLVTTSQGHILINSNLVSSPPQIRAAVEKLGFHWSDVKILLISHAHFDHCAGSAQIKRETGARYMVLDADAPEVGAGGAGNFRYGNEKDMLYPAAKVDRILHDGEKVEFGGATLVARKTAGHTKGCTTWTMMVAESGKSFDAVIVGSPNVNPGYNLTNDPKYPQMAADYAATFRTLHSLPCDIFLGAHGGYYDMLAKYAKLQAGDKNAFVDPAGYKAYVADREQAFRTELALQQKEHPAPHST